MPTLEQIQEKIKNMDGVEKLYAKKEIKELPDILWENEELEKIVQGFFGNHSGVLAATNSRLKEDGILTEEEFSKQKSKILNR